MASTLDQQALAAASAQHPKLQHITYTYGTAGFRTEADLLDSVMFRVGLLAVLRSKNLKGKAIGVMVTASHNPEKDNGVKLVDPMGEMLHGSWEPYATQLANAQTDDLLLAALDSIVKATGTDLSQPAHVVYGHDTRPSCKPLVRALVDGLSSATFGSEAPKVELVNAGLVTTPQLHYLVRCLNTADSPDPYGEPTIDGYYRKLAAAYTELSASRASGHKPSPFGLRGRELLPAITVDCANGVGAPKLKEFVKVIGTDYLPVIVVRDNTTTAGQLNLNCGADFVKTQQRAPLGVKPIAWQRYASFDGDADRIVYYYADADGVFHLLDGDKIATLAAGFIMDLVKDAGLDDKVKVGVVQTAYANGASTKYLTEVLGVPVTCVPTGVKHLHHAAESYDIGVYFEANGHGTVLFSPSTLAGIRSSLDSATSSPAADESQLAARTNLRALTELINQTVGDALSDMLLVETVLLHRQWTPAQWDRAYTDYPNRLVKVLVNDRHAFETTDAERKLVKPEGLQAKIDALCKEVDGGRSFVRPSGTEDCVRVYAEATTRQAADDLVNKAAYLVFDEAGGKGTRPASGFF
ncbi:putative Phosphoacetylglucosamine mutase [Rhodotorula taiwanensis]|uniref:Phosphoacetylglucosamine mutase n=1 Tax=Rhodotorula taiwanensis TaxID=741276 RepID=A0A2S5BHV8_9BASI|nr:putative Phosphoacetylglucosamine mutase [Rhodotorula taiwanensis]